jgi:methionyl-tRNA formyltransferase
MDERLIVGCGESSLEILTLKPEGKREMSATEWLRGARLSPDAQFE